MAKLADAADLKSAGLYRPWGFKSPSGHQKINHSRVGQGGFSRRCLGYGKAIEVHADGGDRDGTWGAFDGGLLDFYLRGLASAIGGVDSGPS